MAYNPYGGPPFGAPPAYTGFPGANAASGMAPPPGLGPPPGMSSAPGMAPPPGVQQTSATQANRPSGLPHNFQAPANMPNINFNARVIRLGTAAPKSTPHTGSGRRDGDGPASGGGRPGLGMDRGYEQSRSSGRDNSHVLVPATNEEKLRTMFIRKIPDGVGGAAGMERLLRAVGKLRRWEPATSMVSDSTGLTFGFAQFEDAESLSLAADLLEDIEVPVKRQVPTETSGQRDNTFEGIEKMKLQVTMDPSSIKYLESYKENRGEDADTNGRRELARSSLQHVIRTLFHPPSAYQADQDGDLSMGDANGTLGENVEVVNIPLAQEDELADIPAEMREVVAQEIAAFRDRSNKRDLERLRREEELEELERQRSGMPRLNRAESPPGNSSGIPIGPRGMQAPSGPKSQNGVGRVSFVNGGIANADLSIYREDEDTDASDEELQRRQAAKQKADEDKMYLEAERKWVNRERARAAALDRERDREKADTDSSDRRRQEQLDRETAWDDEREASRKAHLYYRDHAAWARKRGAERAEEESRDEADRRAEEDERRREAMDRERARGIADSFLDQQAREMERHEPASVAAPQPFKLSLGAAAQKAQAQRAAPQRRTIAEVEGLLDDEEQDQTSRRQLVPIQFEPTTSATSMSDEELTKAVRALAQEIPSDKDGLWKWEVQWDFLYDSTMREKLRPFVEKKIVEYLGVQEEVIVEVIEDHLRKHGKPGELVDELAEALDEDAEDLVKKLWRMLIFFTESEKRGLPA